MVPSDHGLWLDDDHGIKTTRPDAIDQEPKNSVQSRESNPSRAGALENFQLMTQDDDLELQRGAASEAAENAIEEARQDHSHRPTLREVAAKY